MVLGLVFNTKRKPHDPSLKFCEACAASSKDMFNPSLAATVKIAKGAINISAALFWILMIPET